MAMQGAERPQSIAVQSTGRNRDHFERDMADAASYPQSIVPQSIGVKRDMARRDLADTILLGSRSRSLRSPSVETETWQNETWQGPSFSSRAERPPLSEVRCLPI